MTVCRQKFTLFSSFFLRLPSREWHQNDVVVPLPLHISVLVLKGKRTGCPSRGYDGENMVRKVIFIRYKVIFLVFPTGKLPFSRWKHSKAHCLKKTIRDLREDGGDLVLAMQEGSNISERVLSLLGSEEEEATATTVIQVSVAQSSSGVTWLETR